MSKKPFHVVLTDAERAKLEAVRAQLGLRSQADVIRHWIAYDLGVPNSYVRVARTGLAHLKPCRHFNMMPGHDRCPDCGAELKS